MDLKSATAKKDILFFNENDNCPTCEQHIDEEFKKKAIEERTNKMITSACTSNRNRCPVKRNGSSY